MKLTTFKPRNINIDAKLYSLSVSYGGVISPLETVKFKSFDVYHSIDSNKVRFVVSGTYINSKKENQFELCVNEVDWENYNTKLIEHTFFINRADILQLIQAVHKGYVIKDEQKKEKEIETIELKEELFDDTFVKEEIVIEKELISEKDEAFTKAEPNIVLPKLRVSGRKTVTKKPTPKKKTTKTTSKAVNK